MRMDFRILKKLSPLYDYWESEQSDLDESRRMLKANTSNPAVYLFEKEPYKWENLFQSILREVIKGDLDSIKGLKVILNCISEDEKKIVSEKLLSNKILSLNIIRELDKPIESSSSTKRNFFRFARILFAIFTNPYQIEIKRKKNHIYERTGSLISNFRKLGNQEDK